MICTPLRGSLYFAIASGAALAQAFNFFQTQKFIERLVQRGASDTGGGGDLSRRRFVCLLKIFPNFKLFGRKQFFNIFP